MQGKSNYKGMRFYKCDLHLHTPEDARHWSDESCKLAHPRDEKDLQAKARLYLQRCHELELECIGITDHIFSAEKNPRMWFLTHLVEQNNSVADELGKNPLVIFPGFELDIRYHLVCLFEPVKKSRDLQLLDQVLSNIGLSAGARWANGAFQMPKYGSNTMSLGEVIKKIQDEHKGIIIAAHAFSNDGICNDSSNIDDFVENNKLYAVEVNSYSFSEKERQILAGETREWKRKKGAQPAALCSSDGKSLQDAQQPNNLGYRFSWIKMSQPSIEALRQAFLDPESRIRLETTPLEVAHTHIKTISVAGTAFLADQQIVFSPHLNCIIGGRGSGKSMLFESIRLGLRGEKGSLSGGVRDSAVRRQVERLQGTFTDSTKIKLLVSHFGQEEDTFIVEQSGVPSRIARQVENSEVIFRQLDALIFSQSEITQLAEEQRSLLDLLDSLAYERINKYRNKAADIVEQVKVARQIRDRAALLRKQLEELKQERDELERQLKAQTEIQEELKKHQTAQEASQYIDGLQNKVIETVDRLSHVAEELSTEPTALGSKADSFPQPDFFKTTESGMAAAYKKLGAAINSASEALMQSLLKVVLDNPAYLQVTKSIKDIEETFQKALADKGLTPESAAQLRATEQQFRKKSAEVVAKEQELATLVKGQVETAVLYHNLSECWLEEYEEKELLLQEIDDSETMPRTGKGTPVVSITVEFAGDREHFLELWGELAPPRNTRLGRCWDRYSPDSEENIGDQLFDAFQNHIKASLSDTTGVESAFNGNPFLFLSSLVLNKRELPPLVQTHFDELKTVLKDKIEIWQKLQVTRVRDSATLTLYRSDGSIAGTLQDNSLSSGQKNTALLSLLLAHGKGPVLIDQPEDELDSAFLYGELVPLFRKAKQRRQLIIVTHNANIPVNADAELIYALEAEAGRGICLNQGGLDCESVAEAVLDIMEGSEEAFKKRQAKYHF